MLRLKAEGECERSHRAAKKYRQPSTGLTTALLQRCSAVARPYAEDAVEACTHLGLRLAQKRIERGKIRHVRGARQQPNEARRRRLGIELTRPATAQKLREMMTNP